MDHIISKIGVDVILDNTNRIRRALARECENPMPEDVVAIMSSMRNDFDNTFLDPLFSIIAKAVGKEVPTRNKLYDMLPSEPFIAIVMVENTNGCDYDTNVPLVVTTNGRIGLQKPNGTYGDTVSPLIRLATDEEIIRLAGSL